jgi:hypothetical protein
MSSEVLPVIIAQWPRNASDTVIVKIDQFNGTMVIDKCSPNRGDIMSAIVSHSPS